MSLDDMKKRYKGLSDLVLYIQNNHEVGSCLPGERILDPHVGYNRATIRENLIRLECLGYVLRRHGKPTKYVKAF